MPHCFHVKLAGFRCFFKSFGWYVCILLPSWKINRIWYNEWLFRLSFSWEMWVPQFHIPTTPGWLHMCAKIPISWVYPSPINSGSGFRRLKKEVWLWFDWHHVTGYIQQIWKNTHIYKSILIDILAEICTRYALCFSMAPSSLHDSMVAWWYHSLASLSSTAASPARSKIPTKQSQASFVFIWFCWNFHKLQKTQKPFWCSTENLWDFGWDRTPSFKG